MYTVGSMFAGVGGICKGFEQAGFELLWANERDEKACVTYKHNYAHHLDERDITQAEASDFPPADVVTSGFPCQAFSVAGYRQGFDDKKGRGVLFLRTADFINQMKSKAFLLENVKNLAGHDGGNTLKEIRRVMEEDLGYSFIPFILNSKNFGVPQTRERVYIVGFRGEAGFDEAKHAKNDPKKYPCSHAFSVPDEIRKPPHIQDFLLKGRQDDKYYYSEDHPYYEELSKAVLSEDTVYQWRRVYVRENKSNLCPTLTANMGTGGHNVPLVLDKYGIRKLTPEECFRFQGYYLEDDAFKLPEGMANSHLYKQAGNSVSVPVIKAIAQNMRTALDVKWAE
ncbi:DNA (cytosine-5-)-methyltransferase [Pontiella sulfatireligans]|uniref:Cytosine-specific methyltransferase n=1 Tax=Pontiella sulfatireligans TaxID=2750658 RepID=A0A6C2UMH7_9BACT|nr:DNA (cytosine-5-)-methyltransferase [Pontiella sulfatireligans]VGO21465.1 Modification methylase HpaII [Pontiella sulfatireligans]